VARQFLACCLAADAALVYLDLAKLYLLQGRARETRELAFEAEAWLRKLGVEREAEEAVLLCWKAAQQEGATLDLVEQAIEALERARPLPRGKVL
jgi:hypothetical protein